MAPGAIDDGDERVTEETRGAESEQARAPHRADRPPTREEQEEVRGREVDPSVREHYEEMTRTGGQEAGEGRIP